MLHKWRYSHCTSEGNCWIPIIIDVSGNGFDLTDGLNGVDFKPGPNDDPIRTGWTSANSDDAFLVLDKNGNGLIDDGSELFGFSTPQPEPPPGIIKNGFLALAEYDKPANGGNGDGKINRLDSIYRSLRLWHDINHNGISEPSELKTLWQLGIGEIDLGYVESNFTDTHGNLFKYWGRVRGTNGVQNGRWAVDVFPTVHR